MGKKFEELNVIDDFLITLMSTDEELREDTNRLIVSTLLQRKLGKIHVSSQKVLPSVFPGCRGIRMDVELEEAIEHEEGTENNGPNLNIYDVEPHLKDDMNFPRYNRYRQATIDGKRMRIGDDNFDKFPNLYVIIILNFDLFGKDYMMYTFHNTCEEVPEISYDDGLKFIYFYTGGNKGGNEEIKKFLRYLENSTEENVLDENTKKMHELVQKVKKSPERRESYMTLGQYFDRMQRAEHRAGQNEGKLMNQISIIRKRIAKGKEIEEIADILDMEISELQPLYDLVANNPEKTEQELVEEYLKSKQLQTV